MGKKRIKTSKPRVGRPVKFQTIYCGIARRFYAMGYDLPELAALLGVSTSTVYNWKTDFAEFQQAINDGRLDRQK